MGFTLAQSEWIQLKWLSLCVACVFRRLKVARQLTPSSCRTPRLPRHERSETAWQKLSLNARDTSRHLVGFAFRQQD
jgi:hypothetical protein